MVIKVKGRAPENEYSHSLPQVFDAFGQKVFSVEECISILSRNGILLDEPGLYKELFSYRTTKFCGDARELPFSFAGPFQMRSVVDSRFRFNLQYQDAVIKIELEKRSKGNEDQAQLDIVLQGVLESVSTILRTAFFSNESLYLELTNMELDHVVMKCLDLLLQDGQHRIDPQDLVSAGNAANLIAFLVQNRILSAAQINVNNILPFLLFSGIVWWSDPEIQNRFQRSREEVIECLLDQLQELAHGHLGINDFPTFCEEVLQFTPRKNLLLFLDDNGELVWELLFVRLLLDTNPNLTVMCVVNTVPVTNNVSSLSLLNYLESDGTFLDLLHETRFQIVGEPNELPALDLRFISDELKERINEADIILVNGVSFFERLQYLPKPTYYLFTVYSETSKILTGFERNTGIFARLGPHLCGFSDIQCEDSQARPRMVLSEIHAAVRSLAYKNFVRRFPSEGDANLWLRNESIQTAQTFEEIIRQL